MANRQKGEIAVAIPNGEGTRELTFRLGINEMIGLQDAFGMNNEDERFLATLDKPGSLKRLRLMVFWGLKYGQPEITEEQAGDIITELGVPKVRKLIDEAVTWALPESEPGGGAVKGKGVAASPGALPS